MKTVRWVAVVLLALLALAAAAEVEAQVEAGTELEAETDTSVALDSTELAAVDSQALCTLLVLPWHSRQLTR